MSQVTENMEHEDFEKSIKTDEAMTLVEYAEKIALFPLSGLQKELLEKYEQCLKKKELSYVVMPQNVGREFAFRTIEEWKKRNELHEYRCPCGRLLGKFAGQAEVKCPKCRKVNMIGVEENE